MDPAGPDVLDASGRRRSGADGDVRSRRSARVADDEQDQRQAQRPEYEPDRRSEIAGDERAGER